MCISFLVLFYALSLVLTAILVCLLVAGAATLSVLSFCWQGDECCTEKKVPPTKKWAKLFYFCGGEESLRSFNIWLIVLILPISSIFCSSVSFDLFIVKLWHGIILWHGVHPAILPPAIDRVSVSRLTTRPRSRLCYPMVRK